MFGKSGRTANRRTMPSRPLHSARLLAAATAALALAACADSPVPVQPDADAPSLARDQGRGRVIPGRFIVQLEPRTNAREVARGYGVAPDHVYETAIVGFAGSISEAARAGLMRDSRVVRIEQDQVVSAFDTQTGATWGLDRIDQRSLPLSGSYSYENDGSGVTAYILDTGIRSTHNEFTGRVGAGADFVNVGTQPDDCNEHGTHVAGTVGGTRYGVAKGVTLVAVRVLDCQGNGTWAGVIAGIDWVAANHDSPAVANMSLGGGASAS